MAKCGPVPQVNKRLRVLSIRGVGCCVRVKWVESDAPHYDGVVQAYKNVEGEHLVRIKYDIDKRSLFHSTLPIDNGGTDITPIGDQHDDVRQAGYEPFLAPIIANIGEEDADDLVATMQLGELNMLCSALGASHRRVYDQYFDMATSPGLYTAEYQLYDITNGDIVQKEMITATDGKKAVEINLDEASRLHEPKNERGIQHLSR